jgi:hypothetical protein
MVPIEGRCSAPLDKQIEARLHPDAIAVSWRGVLGAIR